MRPASSTFLRACRGRARRARARSGSCARRVARCPSTGRCADRRASSTRSATPSSPTEITLQPVRRYGVDAAILFSDIVVPLAAIGVGVEIVAGRGPVIDRAVPHEARTSSGSGRSSRSSTRRTCSRPCESSSRELDVPLIGFAGRAVHRRELPHRGRPVAGLRRARRRSCTRDPALLLALLDRLADLALASLRSQIAAGAAAVQLFDCWAGALSRERLRRASSLPASTKVLAASPTSGCRASTSASAPASCSTSWPRRARTSSASTGGSRSRRAAQRVGPTARAAGQPRSGAAASRGSTSSRPRPHARPRARTGGAGPHLQPRARRPARHRPDVLTRLVELVHEEPVAARHRAGRGRARERDAAPDRRRRHGLRDPAAAPPTSSRTTPTSAAAVPPTRRAARRPRPPVRRDRRRLAARRSAPPRRSPPSGARSTALAPGRVRRRPRREARPPEDRGGGRRARRRGASTARRARARAALRPR